MRFAVFVLFLLIVTVLAIRPLKQRAEATSAPSKPASSACLKQWDALTDAQRLNLLRYSGKGVNDIGNWDECNLLPNTHHCLTTLHYVEQDIDINLGVCAPSACNASDIEAVVLQTPGFLKELGRELNTSSNPILRRYAPTIEDIGMLLGTELSSRGTYCREQKYKFSAAAIVYVTIMALLIVLVALSTAYDYFLRWHTERAQKRYEKAMASATINIYSDKVHNDNFGGSSEDLLSKYGEANDTKRPEKPQTFMVKLLMAFSVIHNTERLFSKPKGNMPILNGLKVISMFWVITGHSAVIWEQIGGGFTNFDYVTKVAKPRWSFQLIWNAPYSVDTFFFISGFLMALMFIRKLESGSKMTPFRWVMAYVHRYLRLTPIYAFFLFMFMYMTPYLGNGPLWAKFSNSFPRLDSCHKWWFTNLLYINNLVPWTQVEVAPWDKPDLGACMSWTWYLANDFQFYAFLLPLVYVFYKWPIIGSSIMYLMLSGSMLARGIMSGYYNLNVAELIVANVQLKHGTSEVIGWVYYVQPWYRVCVYIIGIFFAIWYQRRTKAKKNIPYWLVLIGWFIAAFILLSLLFANQPLYTTANTVWPSWIRCLWNAFDRPLWAIGIGIITVTFLMEHGGFAKHILSLDIWLPLSRLTLAAYLFHPIWLIIVNSSRRDIVAYSDIGLMVLVTCSIFVSYLGAAAAYLLVEKPFMNLEMLLFTPRRRPQRKVNSSLPTH